MELVPTRRLELVTGRAYPELAEEIAQCLGISLGETNLREFADSELHCRYGNSIRGVDLFIVQTHCAPVNDSMMEQLIMIDAAKRASAKRITAVCPYYGYSRQDRKSTGREPITAKLVADLFSAAGADRIVSVDLHSGQIQGFFDGPVDHLTAAPVLLDYLRRERAGDSVIVAPDAGRVKVAKSSVPTSPSYTSAGRARGPTRWRLATSSVTCGDGAAWSSTTSSAPPARSAPPPSGSGMKAPPTSGPWPPTPSSPGRPSTG
jgi:phosphoribosylpyrophosphate synthetase